LIFVADFDDFLTRQAENWNTEELARDIINSGIMETVAKATYGYWHSSFHEYFAAVELAASLARREAERWELIRKKHTYSRWTEVLRLTVGVLVNEYHDEGMNVAFDWLRELAEQRKSSEGDPGDLGLALVLTSLGEVGDRAALWTNSNWVQLEEAVANTWTQALIDASLYQQVVRQKRLLNMAQDLRHLCPSAIALVVEHLGGDTFSKKRSAYAAALQALGKLGRHAPISQLLHALWNKYESIRQPAVQALAELNVLVPREALASVLESESHVARAAAAHATAFDQHGVAADGSQRQWEEGNVSEIPDSERLWRHRIPAAKQPRLHGTDHRHVLRDSRFDRSRRHRLRIPRQQVPRQLEEEEEQGQRDPGVGGVHWSSFPAASVVSAAAYAATNSPAATSSSSARRYRKQSASWPSTVIAPTDRPRGMCAEVENHIRAGVSDPNRGGLVQLGGGRWQRREGRRVSGVARQRAQGESSGRGGGRLQGRDREVERPARGLLARRSLPGARR